jgi:lipopolysaccharide transport system ATP-binding protein
MNAIEFNHVWKKFNKGEKFNSLRDAIPNFFRKAVTRPNGALKKEEFWALKDVSFEVKKGGVVGIIGSNGAGKSTILKLLSRILVPNKGSMQINGRLSALIEVTAGFHPDLTGRENVYLNGTILGMRKREIDTKFDEIVDFSGVREFIDTPVKRYSSGMFARLGFSVAAHMNPDILLVDEVLAVGDMSFQAKCAEKMRSLLSSGTTIILVSHNITLVQTLCKRVILLDKGVIVKNGDPKEVITHYQNLVFENQENELKKAADHTGYKIRISGESTVEITKVEFCDSQLRPKNNFEFGDPIAITVHYDAKEKIENPVFDIEIRRADGVLCCNPNTRYDGLVIDSINGKGQMTVNLGKVNLAPGAYIVKSYLCDRDMTHLLATRNSDVLRIMANASLIPAEIVFMPPVEWKLG